MSFALLGLGTASPSHSIFQSEAAELAKPFCSQTAREARLLETIYERTQVKKRRSVLDPSFFPPLRGKWDKGPTTGERMDRYAEEAAPLALAAARQALDHSEVPLSQISYLVTVSCTGFVAPGLDIALIHKLGLSPSVARTHIGFMGCHGGMNGLRIASALAETDREARILLCAVELCSLHFSYGLDPGRMIANGLFADGAGAVVGRKTTEAPPEAWKVTANGSFVFPDSEDTMGWRIGDHGFEMTLSPDVPALIAAHLKPWLMKWLAQRGWAIEEIRSWAIHPGGPRILDAVAEALSLHSEMTAVSREILNDYGNLSSATLFFILERLRSQGAPRPCLALGFGPGLAAEAVLFL